MKHSVPFPRRSILLHGWDAQARSWHGPTPVAPKAGHRALGALKKVRGAFHVGTFRRSVESLPPVEFHTAFYDREHAGIAIVDLEGAGSGSVALVVVVPDAHCRPRLPDDFAEDLMRLACLLGGPHARLSALQVQDYLQRALLAGAASSHVFSLELSELEPDVAIVLSTYVVEIATSMLDWMAARQARREPLNPVPGVLVRSAAAAN